MGPIIWIQIEFSSQKNLVTIRLFSQRILSFILISGVITKLRALGHTLEYSGKAHLNLEMFHCAKERSSLLLAHEKKVIASIIRKCLLSKNSIKPNKQRPSLS